MKTLSSLLCTATAVAFLTIPAEPAQADLLRVCAKNGGGNLHTGKCRRGEKQFTLDRPMANHEDVKGIAPEEQGECGVMDEFLGGDVALCVSHDIHDPVDGNGYGGHCFLYADTFIPLQRAGAYGEGEPVSLGWDEVTGRADDKNHARAIITFVDYGGIVTAEPVKYMRDDGYVIAVENIELLWPEGQECRAYARTSARLR